MKIDAIYGKLQNLERLRKTLVMRHKSQLAELDMQIAEERKALARIEEAIKPLLCPNCNGSGSKRYCDAAGDMDDSDCQVCKGTGIGPRPAGKGK